MDIQIPENVKYIITKLERSGHRAYAVGGCVRDSILRRPPMDWDVCTSALPSETMKCFIGHEVIKTGISYGTLTLILDGEAFEITTFRMDGDYSDGRRPDRVRFIKDVGRDLSRRDFTINAMAYNRSDGIVDFFGGKKDLDSRIIKCVGNPQERFMEDSLRIMRALRFASELGFSIEKDTEEAIFKNKMRLRNVAAERIFSEFKKMLIGESIIKVIFEFFDVINEIIPELKKDMISDKMDCVPRDEAIRLAFLFKSLEISTVEKILMRLRCDGHTSHRVKGMIRHRSLKIPSDKIQIKCYLKNLGENMLRDIAAMRGIANLDALDEIVNTGECFSLDHLAVNGRDIVDIGISPGKEVGKILDYLLDMVIKEKIKNSKEDLIKEAENIAGNM